MRDGSSLGGGWIREDKENGEDIGSGHESHLGTKAKRIHTVMSHAKSPGRRAPLA